MGPIVSSNLPLPMILAITRAYMTWALKACTENFLKYCTILFSFQIKDRRWIFMNKNPAFAVSFQQHDLISFEKKGNHDIQCIYNSICHFVYDGQCVKINQTENTEHP